MEARTLIAAVAIAENSQLQRMLRDKIPLPEISFETKEDASAQLLKLGSNADNVFFKCTSFSAQTVWGSRWNSILTNYYQPTRLCGEISQQLKIYRVVPDDAARPIATATMEGRNVGYFLEYVNGTSLGGLGLQSFREAVLKLVSVMEKVHGAGVGHGDLDSSSNIRVTISPVGIKLIDPYVPSDKTDADLIKQDKESLRQMLHMANGTLSR